MGRTLFLSTAVLVSLAVAATGWASVALARMVAEFHHHGVPIDMVRTFADRGWLAVSIDYTLSSVDRHLWDITASQVGCAMAWTAASAARLGGDPARISLLGSSAGGNLAINAAYLANAGRLESSCGGIVPRVSAVSVLYPPVDLAAAWVSKVPVISDMARQFNTYYVGGSPQQFPDRYRFVASATYINAAAPPTLVIFGENDHLVPPEATDRFVQQARSAGIDIESVRFPYGDHAFNLNQYGVGNQKRSRSIASSPVYRRMQVSPQPSSWLPRPPHQHGRRRACHPVRSCPRDRRTRRSDPWKH
jgi:acetyl esterase/lipase